MNESDKNVLHSIGEVLKAVSDGKATIVSWEISKWPWSRACRIEVQRSSNGPHTLVLVDRHGNVHVGHTAVVGRSSVAQPAVQDALQRLLSLCRHHGEKQSFDTLPA